MTPVHDPESGMDDREAIARRIEAQLGVRPPEALLDIWTGVTPTDSSVDVYMYGPDEIAERNTTFEIPVYRPDLLLMGDDGGGRGLFVTRNEADPEVFRIGLGAVGSDHGERIGRLSALAADGFRSTPDEGTGADKSPPLEPIDILIACRPTAGVKALVDIRKLLGLSVPIGQLTAGNADFPMVVLTDVRYSKYEKAITEINRRYGCLAVRPHSRVQGSPSA
jgi:hypothetical protein